ncbi:hypothetical protein BJ742DRAFT_841787 [Cladochytrium replicatum]|nr:hypothetical protein BJ742DRAFT_841787 [Cladochytrium replicatum]
MLADPQLPTYKVFFVGHGSRGDHQPGIAAAQLLQRSNFKLDGRSVKGYVIADPDYEAFCQRLGVSYLRLGNESLIASMDASKNVNPLDAAWGVDLVLKLQRLLVDVCEKEGADMLIAVTGAQFFAHNVARKLGIPYGLLSSVPLPFPGRELPSALLGTGMMSPFLNSLSNEFTLFLLWQLFKPRYKIWQKDLDVPSQTNYSEYRKSFVGQDVFLCLSPHLVPRPKAWPETIVMGGTLSVIEEDNGMEEGLAQFLDDGTPPIFIGFGSLTRVSDSKFLSFVERTVELLVKERIILYLGGASTNASANEELRVRFSSERVYVVFSVAHSVVLPRCKLMVHHGGSGTLQSALMAGTPSVMVTFMVDQPLFCDLMHAKELVPECLRYSSVTPERLESVIHKALDPVYKERTVAFRKLLQDDPVKEKFTAWISKLHSKGASVLVSQTEASGNSGSVWSVHQAVFLLSVFVFLLCFIMQLFYGNILRFA